MSDNHTPARGIMGLMQPKGPTQQPSVKHQLCILMLVEGTQQYCRLARVNNELPREFSVSGHDSLFMELYPNKCVAKFSGTVFGAFGNVLNS